MSNDANWYTNVFKTWQVKQLGPKPTAEMLANIHKLNARPGKQALACAMATRDGGVTGAQIVIACGAPQLNKMRGFIVDGLLKRLPAPPSAEGHQVYKLELTAKGKQRIERNEKAAAKASAAGEAAPENGEAKPAKPAKAPSKAKGKLKVKTAPKAAKPETPTSEPASAAEAVPEVTEAEAAAPDNAA